MTKPAVLHVVPAIEPATVLIADEDEIDAAIDRAIREATETAAHAALVRAEAPPTELTAAAHAKIEAAIDEAIDAAIADAIQLAATPAIEAAITAAVADVLDAELQAVPVPRHYDLHNVWRRHASGAEAEPWR